MGCVTPHQPLKSIVYKLKKERVDRGFCFIDELNLETAICASIAAASI